jgi:hypothetical protein
VKEVLLKFGRGWASIGSWCVRNSGMLLSTIGAQGIFTAILGGVIKAIGIEAAGISCFLLFIIASSLAAVLIGLRRDDRKALAVVEAELAALKAVPGPPRFLSVTSGHYLDWDWHWRWSLGSTEPAVSAIEELYCYCPDCAEPVLPTGFSPGGSRLYFGTDFRCKGCGRKRDIATTHAEVIQRVKGSIYRDAKNPPPVQPAAELVPSGPQ